MRIDLVWLAQTPSRYTSPLRRWHAELGSKHIEKWFTLHSRFVMFAFRMLFLHLLQALICEKCFREFEFGRKIFA